MKKILFLATVTEGHILAFHKPYIKMLSEEYAVDVISYGKENIPFCNKHYDVKMDRNPVSFINLKAFFKIRKIIRQNEYSVLSCHTPVGGMLGRLCSIGSTAKVVYTAHGFHFFKGNSLLKNLIYKSAEKFLAHYTDVIITINEEDFNAAKGLKLKKGGKVIKINGIGVNTKKIESLRVDIQEKRKSFGIGNEKIILTVGELIERKNYKTALEAFSMISDKTAKYIICGKGRQEAALKKYARRLNISERVIFAGFRKDIYEILKISDLFFFPSYQEGMPLALMEAMAAGLPIVCSEIRGNKDLMKNAAGFMAKPSDSKAFAEKIDMVMKNKISGEKNKKAVLPYDIENIKPIMKKLFYELS